jgi:hypothetical protein
LHQRNGLGFAGGGAQEHDPEKREPVFRKDHAQTNRRDHERIVI